MKQKQLKEIYDRFNCDIFGGRCPDTCEIRITRGHSMLASALRWDDGKVGIYFQKQPMVEHMKMFPKTVTWESVMLHEMLHIVEGIMRPKNKLEHSPWFYAKLKRIERKTCIPQFWDFIK